MGDSTPKFDTALTDRAKRYRDSANGIMEAIDKNKLSVAESLRILRKIMDTIQRQSGEYPVCPVKFDLFL